MKFSWDGKWDGHLPSVSLYVVWLPGYIELLVI